MQKDIFGEEIKKRFNLFLTRHLFYAFDFFFFSAHFLTHIFCVLYFSVVGKYEAYAGTMRRGKTEKKIFLTYTLSSTALHRV